MGLREQLMDDLKEAMRQRDRVRTQSIRSVVAAIKKVETELDSKGARIHLDDQGIVAQIAKQANMRQESIDAFRAGGREDLVADEAAELAILQSYLPKQLSREQIEAEALQVIAEVGATSISDLGRVMRPLMDRLKGKADGRLVNQVVRGLLNG